MSRVDSFISSPDASTLTGERRMGVECLLDLLAKRITETSGNNVIRITEVHGAAGRVRELIDPERENHIILYVDICDKEYEAITASFPRATVYRAKELCHQVPVCFKGVTGHNGC